jgi:dihydrofolate reductase
MTTRDLPTVDGDVRFAQGDVRAVHAAMTEAAGGKDLWVVGGGDLAGQFAEAGLLDEVIVYIAPVTLGGGAPLLPRRLDLRLEELAQNRAFACARYAVLSST